MKNYKLFFVIQILSNFVLLTGCMKNWNSDNTHIEHSFSKRSIEHTVPFKVYNDLPLVNCSLNGNEAVPFLVDTGASTNVIDNEYAKTIGIPPISEEYNSLQGIPTRDALIDNFNIGTFENEKISARLMNLKDILPKNCPAKGILGYPLFRRMEICIDYPKHTISFREGANNKLDLSFNPIFTFVIMPVMIENQGPFNFIFDTGSNISLVEPYVLDELNPPKKDVPVVRIKTAGTGEGFALVRQVKDSRSEGITDTRELVRRACGLRIDGVLGWRHIRDYKVTINYTTCTYQFKMTGYPKELKPVIVNISPDISKSIDLGTKELLFEFSIPMNRLVSYLSTFECKYSWLDDNHLKLIIQEELKADNEYEIIFDQGLCSKNGVPLDWTDYKFKVVSNH